MTDEELKKLVESNAKAIQALTNAMTDDRERWRQERTEWRQDRRRVFEWMSRLAAAQADFYEMQADHLTHLERIDERLGQILEHLTQKDD